MINFSTFDIGHEISQFTTQPNPMRSLVILVLAIVFSYWLSFFVSRIIVKVAQRVATRADNTEDEATKIKLRRIETYLSVSIALIRALMVGFAAFTAWKFLSPAATSGAAAIGASAFFVVLASATIGMVLRDVTAGSAMIIERWFNVGDFIRVEPFMDVTGVVERMTLRSTKVRSLNGEVIWIHNQHMQAVKVTPNGIRTIAVDVFVNNERIGRTMIEKAIATIPVGTMTVTRAPKISRSEQWADHLWVMTIVGQTPPGREWIMEKYFVDSLKELDEKRTRETIVRPPLVRFADAAAERSFKRAVRANTK